MIEKRNGVVSRIESGYAYVIPEKMELCRECTLCERGRGNELKTLNRAGASAGERVSFEIDLDSLNFKFIRLFSIALALLLAGAGGGYFLGEVLSVSPYLVSLAGALLALALSFLLLRDRRVPECAAVSVRVLKEKEE